MSIPLSEKLVIAGEDLVAGGVDAVVLDDEIG